MAQHPNIDPKSLTAQGRLLRHMDLIFVASIESFVKQLQTQAGQVRQNKQALITLLEQLTLANDPYFHVDKILLQQPKETNNTYKNRVAHELQLFLDISKSDGTRNFIQELKDNLSAIPQHESSYETYLDCLNETWEKHEDDAQDLVLNADLEARENKLTTLINQEEERLNQKIAQFKEQHHANFDLSEDYELLKISKQSYNLNYSVVYAKKDDNDKPTALALYRGGEGKLLGEGGFGKVKLCQNIHTGEWLAIKIQQRIMRQAAQGENTALKSLQRYAGELTRNEKYYSIQTLLPGIDLYKHIQQNPDDSALVRIKIAIKAAELVHEFHKSYLHRDLKPENFIWDSETNDLYLCDFGMAISLDASQNTIQDLSGSGTYLAPEINDALHHGVVAYSKKSDIYALGKVFAELFKDIDPLPESIPDLIAHMTQFNTDDRPDSTQQIIESLHNISHYYHLQNKLIE